MRRTLVLLLLFVSIGLVILLPVAVRPTDLIYPAHSQFSDLTITHWPAFAYARDQLASTGQIPLWRTSILSGTPFAADPLSGMFYPPHWLALVPGLPLSLVFNGLMLLHLSLAAVAMYIMLRGWQVGRAGSIAAAIAFAAAPKIVAHMGVGHVTLVEAWAWLPLVIAGLRDDVSSAPKVRMRVVWSGVALAMCLLADARMAVYALALALTYLLFRDAHRARTSWLKLIGRGAIILVAAAALSAVAWLPALTLTSDTARSSLSLAEASAQLLDPAYRLGSVIADRSGAAERTTYLGLVVLVLAAAGVKLAHRSRPRTVGWLVVLIAAAATVALGVNTPVYGWLYRLPGSTLLRVPARAWFVVTFAIAALAGLGLQGLIDWSGRAQRRSVLLAIALTFFALAFGLIGGVSTGSISLFAVAVWAPIAVVAILLRIHYRLSPGWLAVVMVVCLSIDLISVDWALYRPVSIAQAFEDGRDAAVWLAEQPGLFRVYSPSYSIPQQVAQAYHLQLADGIDPLQLSRYVAYMQQASGEGAWGYSVTLPAFSNVKTDEAIRTALANVTPNSELLGLMNVKYVVSAFPIAHFDLVERARFGSTYIYENVRLMPRAFVVGRVAVVPDRAAAAQWLAEQSTPDAAIVEGLPQSIDLPIQPHEAEIVEWQADQIEVRTHGPGLLVLSEVYAPGWTAEVDSQPVEVYPTDLALRGVFVPWGAHTIDFNYQPRPVYAGVLITALSVIACMGAIVIRSRTTD